MASRAATVRPVTAQKTVVVGQGYVGLPVAMAAVRAGYDVTGIELNEARAKALQDGDSYIEDISSDTLAEALATGRYRASTTFDAAAGFDVAVISVPTPLADGVPDLTYIESAAASLAPHVTVGSTVILESTTYPGTTEELVGPILEAGSGLAVGADFHLGYSPERIDPGNATYTLENTPKVVSGVDDASLDKVDEFFSALVDQTVRVPGCKEAELTKLLENTFRHVNIALVNELAMFAADLGVDVWASIDAASTKPFGYMRFTPGPGVGGHCLPIDPSFLSWRVKRSLGVDFRFVELANDVNEHMPDFVVRRLMLALNARQRAVSGSRILLLGLAYKPNTSDARETPSTRVAQLLTDLGAELAAADPHVAPDAFGVPVERVELTAEELEAADVVVLICDHDAFDYDLVARHAVHVLDCRNRMPTADNVERL
ncbi:nucleotide sugar dehydrogenase [Actinospongicola halichondriae]|uniref:nucleotide sugar dehydrogenase n=1 Tax=Actinospongicola halichondriae TaxID=3236844 RepID=UPI003D3BD5AF